MIHYCIICGTVMKQSELICPHCGHCPILDELEQTVSSGVAGLSSAQNAMHMESNIQWTKYRAGLQGRTGHGFAAEDANNLYDKLRGREVIHAGWDNSDGGADRIVNGDKIQTKYYQTARGSVMAAFDKDGKYRYEGQTLEVPKEQYEEAVRVMREEITKGNVPGHTNPDDATKIVKKGYVTYQQSCKIAKAGNIHSLCFDIQSGAVVATTAFGISFAIQSGLGLLHCHSKEDVNSVVKNAFELGLRNGTISMTGYVAEVQLLRTTLGRNMAAGINGKAKILVQQISKTKTGNKAIDGIASTIHSKPLSGAAARSAAIKALRTNIVSNIVMTTVITLPDMYRCFLRKEMSNGQFVKNLVVNASAISGATIGTFVGMAVGGRGSGIIGGVVGGFGTSLLSKVIADKISKDDNEKMMLLVKIAMLQLAEDYILQDEDEFSRCTSIIKNKKLLSPQFLRAMYTIGSDNNDDETRVRLAYTQLEYAYNVVARQRNEKLRKFRLDDTKLEGIIGSALGR